MATFIETYVNPRTGQRRQAPQGFSWTTLLFGVVTIVTGGIAWFVFPFFYNARYAEHLRNDGFEAEEGAQPGSSSLLGISR